MSYEVRFLTDEEVASLLGYEPWNDCASTIGIFIDGKLYADYSDGGEPEDQTFGRDWSWVVDELEK